VAVIYLEDIDSVRFSFYKKIKIVVLSFFLICFVFMLEPKFESYFANKTGMLETPTSEYFYLEPNPLNSLVDHDEIIGSIDYVKKEPMFVDWALSDEKGLFLTTDSSGRVLSFFKLKSEDGILIHIDPLMFLKKKKINKYRCWV